MRKVWRQMVRERFYVARCTVARVMRGMCLRGVIRGRPVRTTVADKTAPCPLECEPGFRCAGAEHALALRLHLCQHLVGLRLHRLRHRRLRPSHCRLARIADRTRQLGARRLEQALHDRRPIYRGGLVHYSDRGLNTSSFDTPSASPRLVLSPLSVALTTARTTLSPRRSTASTNRISFTGVDPGAASRPSNLPR